MVQQLPVLALPHQLHQPAPAPEPERTSSSAIAQKRPRQPLALLQETNAPAAAVPAKKPKSAATTRPPSPQAAAAVAAGRRGLVPGWKKVRRTMRPGEYKWKNERHGIVLLEPPADPMNEGADEYVVQSELLEQLILKHAKDRGDVAYNGSHLRADYEDCMRLQKGAVRGCASLERAFRAGLAEALGSPGSGEPSTGSASVESYSPGTPAESPPPT